MKNSYTSKDISVLDEIEHIQLNAGMYVGDTSTPTHLVEEAIDNSLDECLAGYATIIAVNINIKDNVCRVIDNGRGIPLSNDTPKIVSTKLFSGAKFQHTKTAYKIVSGLHGIGLVAVNALSEQYIVEIYRDGKHGIFIFENSKLKNKKIEKFIGDKPFATKIQFKPSSKIFETLQPDIDRIKRRLLIASVELPGTTFVLDVNDNRHVIKINKQQYFSSFCLGHSDTSWSEVVSVKAEDGSERTEVMFCYSLDGSISPRVLSSVNLLPVDNGGTHVNYFFDILREIFTTRAKRIGVKFQPQDCLCGLRAYLSLYLTKPEFQGQTKDRLVNRKSHLDKLLRRVKQGIEAHFEENPEQLERLLGQFEQYRKKLDSRKLRSTVNGRRASTKFTKLRDCTSRNGELFIVEGQSASGSLIQCRNPRTHAVLPLKGKIPNVSNTKDILKNKEVGELIQALGTGVGPDFDISKLRYDKVICACDSDPDGSHIASLITMLLAVLVPEVIRQGKYYIAHTPLFAINEGKIFIPLWTDKEVRNAMEKNRNISRFKGLGELSPHQLKFCLVDEKKRRLIPLTFSSNINKLIKLFSEADEKRKLLGGEDGVRK